MKRTAGSAASSCLSRRTARSSSCRHRGEDWKSGDARTTKACAASMARVRRAGSRVIRRRWAGRKQPETVIAQPGRDLLRGAAILLGIAQEYLRSVRAKQVVRGEAEDPGHSVGFAGLDRSYVSLDFGDRVARELSCPPCSIFLRKLFCAPARAQAEHAHPLGSKYFFLSQPRSHPTETRC